MGLHLALVAARHHTQFKRYKKQSDRKLIGVPMFPGQAPRSLGLMLVTAALLFLLGGLIQSNPIWQWGPYETGLGTNGAQPDWYLGWLIGALRIMPGFDVTIGDYTLVPNPFWGGILFPTIVMGVLLAFPWLERRRTGDHAVHNVLDRPSDAPGRTAFGAAFLSWVVIIFFAGSADRTTVYFGLSYTTEIWVYRFVAILLPFAVFFITRRVCHELQAGRRRHAEREAAELAGEMDEKAVAAGARAVPAVPYGERDAPVRAKDERS
jgi:ubiquinol-cytochrome c reductase cytochrome b subunit